MATTLQISAARSLENGLSFSGRPCCMLQLVPHGAKIRTPTLQPTETYFVHALEACKRMAQNLQEEAKKSFEILLGDLPIQFPLGFHSRSTNQTTITNPKANYIGRSKSRLTSRQLGTAQLGHPCCRAQPWGERKESEKRRDCRGL